MKYLEPEMEIMVLESDDVIRTSGLTNGGGDNNSGCNVEGGDENWPK